LNAQGIIISDAFTNKSPNRDVGDPLNGTPTEVGGKIWAANPQAVFGYGHITVANPALNDSYIGGFPFTIPADNPLATVEADVDVRGSNWIAVGFSYSAMGGYWGHAQLCILLHPSGLAEVFANATNNLLSRQPAPVFYAAGFNKLKLEYNASAKTVSAWVNGNIVLNRYYLNIPNFSPNIQYAGFHVWNDNNAATLPQMKVDNFAASSASIVNQPPNLVIEKPAENETISGKYNIQGWATHETGVNDIDFFIDGKEVYFRNFNARVPRPDICQIYRDPNCNGVGFAATLDSRGLSNGEHEFKVTATSTQGSKATVTRKFRVSNPDLANTEVIDTFTFKGQPNIPLNGNKTEKGNLTWVAHNSVEYGSGVIRNANGGAGGSHIGGVPFILDPSRPLATVAAEVKVYGSEWIGIGFSRSATGSYWSHGRVWMLLRPNGVVTIFADSTNLILHQQTVPNFNPGVYNALAIAFNKTDKTVSAWVNGVKILDNYDLKMHDPFDLNISHTGFHMYNSNLSISRLMEIDYFAVSASQVQDPRVCITDGFTNISPLRDIGDLLHGTFTESGGRQWNANLWVVFGANSITNTGILDSHIGGVPFNPNGYPGKPVVSVEAMVKVEGSEWIGLGFANDAQGGYWGVGQVWFLLKKTGQTEIWAKGTNYFLGGPFAPVFYATAYNHMRVELDTRDNTFSVWVNNVRLLNRYDLDLKGFRPNITHAGFHMYNGSLRTQGQMKVDDFKVCASATGQVFSATDPNAVQKSESFLPKAGGDNDVAAIPAEYSLAQNYPNPFNPATTIRYGLPKEGHVTLKIYNLTGQEVRTLVDGVQPAGLKSLSWDGKGKFGQQVPSGVYLYRIVSGEFKETKRMTLMK
jgi:hypothetical protein